MTYFNIKSLKWGQISDQYHVEFFYTTYCVELSLIYKVQVLVPPVTFVSSAGE